MIGLVIVTHADLAQGLLDAATSIVGPQERVAVLCVRRDDAPKAAEARLRQLLAAVGADGDGVMVMTDMFGGTPTNLSLDLLDSHRIEVLTGVNLPMVLKFLSSRLSLSLAELAPLLRDYGRQGVVLVSEKLV